MQMKKDELQIISQAILNEVEGYEFYKMASNQAGNNESKEAFLTLANEEQEHVKYLKDLFNSIKDSEKDDFKLALEVSPPSPDIYNWEKVDDKYTSMALSVFSIGIQMEKDSIVFYKDAKAKTKYPQAEKLYDLLIEWEQVHLEQFMDQYKIYKKDWWFDQGFSPF